MCINYRRIVPEADRTRIYGQLNPIPDPLNCPACADALDDFLRSGRIDPVPDNFGVAWTITATWLTHPARGDRRRRTSRYAASELRDLLGLLDGGAECRHVVVHGRRPATPRLTRPIAGLGAVPLHRMSWTDASGAHPVVTLDHWFLILRIGAARIATECFGAPPYLWTADIAGYVREQEFATLEAAFEYETAPQ